MRCYIRVSLSKSGLTVKMSLHFVPNWLNPSKWLKARRDRTAADASTVLSRRTSSLFAGFIGLLVLMLTVRFMILKHPPMRPVFPIVSYQDVLCCVLVAWLFYGLIRLPFGARTRKSIFIAGWTAYLLLAGYTAISAVVYTVLHAPVTYQLLLSADHLAGAEASVRASISLFSILVIVKSFLIFVGVSLGLWHFAPKLVERAQARFYSRSFVIVLMIYFAAAHLWTVRCVRYPPAIENPELAFAISIFRSNKPIVTDRIPAKFFTEFERQRPAHSNIIGPGVTLASLDAGAQSPKNVVMIVLESVGIRRLQLYNAPYGDTPQMERLARHAAVFDRIYVSQAYTSAAMSALFCSLYPQFDWSPITRSAPDIGVPGIADALARRGYTTAFMHSGQLSFDKEGEFLRDHGFQSVIADQGDATGPADAAMLPKAVNWIRANSQRPFFLALWTQDTHHPYFASDSHDYKVSDASLNRYLNAIHSSDALIGRLADAIDAMNLGDDTIIVITGDHGEAFGEHGQLAHNWTVYDEEMRVPLLIVNPHLFAREEHVTRLGRQIDIAPTVLSLLGYDAPSSWQGDSLFDSSSVDHVYLFCRYGDYTFGLADSHFKYVYDLTRDRSELYDLAADPGELRDLSRDPKRFATVRDDHMKVEAWISFQQRYLRDLLNKPRSAQTVE
jgi:lipoteichoic acid synthase